MKWFRNKYLSRRVTVARSSERWKSEPVSCIRWGTPFPCSTVDLDSGRKFGAVLRRHPASRIHEAYVMFSTRGDRGSWEANERARGRAIRCWNLNRIVLFRHRRIPQIQSADKCDAARGGRDKNETPPITDAEQSRGER